ncbi:MAG: chorismate synthase [Candidatus Omnitrophota bacterium]
MRFLTAGESHGEAVAAIIEGFPKGVRVEASFINRELKRRMQGYGRGKRMEIESDAVKIISGLRNKISLGSPICMIVENKDHKIFTQEKDNLETLRVPRPGHADLAGYLKYQDPDLRNILERASARETVARICIGAVCKQLLSCFDIGVVSFVAGVGGVVSKVWPKNIDEIIRKTLASKLASIDSKKEKAMIKEIDRAKKRKDTVGGIVTVWAEGVPAGLGSVMHFDRRLDSKIASYLMSIPSVKAVEIGAGFDYARTSGSFSHDAICFSKSKGFWRGTNHSGGIEGGMSNGSPIVATIAVKPIPTLQRPLASVNILTKKREKAPVVRSDVCVVEAAGVIAENMLAACLADSLLEKAASDSLSELKKNIKRSKITPR